MPRNKKPAAKMVFFRKTESSLPAPFACTLRSLVVALCVTVAADNEITGCFIREYWSAHVGLGPYSKRLIMGDLGAVRQGYEPAKTYGITDGCISHPLPRAS